MKESVQLLYDYVESLGYCPCCTETRKCHEECTIKEDSERVGGSALYVYDRMIEARSVLDEFDKMESESNDVK
jgi:hypothetical protein